MTTAQPMTTEPEWLLEAHGICKSFPGVQALDGAQLRVRRGTLHALVGENGAGKSTLMNILAGAMRPDAGEVHFAGQRVQFRNPREAQLAGISIIFQELNLVPELSVAENIFLGREPLRLFGFVDHRQTLERTRALLEQLELDIDPRLPVSRLSVGAQQIVEIAKALSFEAQLLIMDEPTSAISAHEVAVLFRIIRQLKARGVSIIYITHKLDELPHIADEITVLRDGKFIGTSALADTTREKIIQMMVGRHLADWSPRSETPAGDIVLSARHVSLPHADRPSAFVVRDVSFEVRSGEVLGIFGLMGAGRTELLQSVFGLHARRSTGEILVAGKKVDLDSPRRAIAAGIALAPEDRKGEGLVLPMSVAHNTSLSCLGNTVQLGLIRAPRERELVNRYVDRLDIKTPTIEQIVRNLSGGNQQKVVLAKWLATNPKVLLLDEPTRGIDINAKKEIYTLINELTKSGLGVVMVSSELPEILSIADRILVMSAGRKTAEFDRATATEENIMRAAVPAAEFEECKTT